MEEFVRSCIERYVQLSGEKNIKIFPTPFVPETHEESPAGAPCAKGPVVECQLCRHTFPPSVHESVRILDGSRRRTAQESATAGVPGDNRKTSGSSASVRSTDIGSHQGGAYPSSVNEQSGGGEEAGDGDRGNWGQSPLAYS